MLLRRHSLVLRLEHLFDGRPTHQFAEPSLISCSLFDLLVSGKKIYSSAPSQERKICASDLITHEVFVLLQPGIKHPDHTLGFFVISLFGGW